jgi:CheY-like chemotaxis protein
VAVKSPGEGHGATFIVRLPISITKTESVEEVFPIVPPPIGLDLSLEGMRILVVDDDADACAVLRRILEEQKASVQTVPSAARALEKIRTDPPHVLIGDVGMPEQDGCQFIAAVRMLEGPARTIPAIAVTAFARPQDRIRALQAGYNMHLAKPINAMELVTVIARLKPGA